jgi:hypothetical protein
VTPSIINENLNCAHYNRANLLLHCKQKTLLEGLQVYGLQFVWWLKIVHVYMCTCVHVYMCTCVHVYMCTCVHVYMCTCVHVYMCTCVHVYMCRKNDLSQGQVFMFLQQQVAMLIQDKQNVFLSATKHKTTHGYKRCVIF